MTCRFILGAAGSGKTYFCLDEISRRLAAGERNIYWIVPDQASFIHEQMLAQKTGGYLDAQVMGFGRLAYNAIEFLQSPKLPSLDTTGRVMLVAKLLCEHKQELRAFASSAEHIGFAESLEQVFCELKKCKLNAAKLAEALSDAKGNFADKMHDIMLLFPLYEAAYEGRFRDSDDNTDLLVEAIYAGFLDNACIYIDGFAGFDPIQFDIFAALFARGTEVNICLPLEEKHCGKPLTETHYLHKISELYHKLRGIAVENACPIAENVYIRGEQGRFTASEELAFIAEHLFPITDRAQYTEVPQNVHINSAGSRRREISGVGRQILAMVRSGDYRFSDFSICAKQIDAYEDELSIVFGEMNIPFFIDGQKKMLNHPLIELLRAALETAEKKPNYKQIFAFLKNNFSPLAWQECSYLENYCLAQGIKHYHWRMDKDWTYYAHELKDGRNEESEAAELAKINEMRHRGTDALFRFCDAVQGEHTAAEFIAALRMLIAELEAEARLDAMYKEALQAGNTEEAELHKRAADGIYALFEQAEMLLGDTLSDIGLFAAILEGGFASLRTAMIPPSLDQVFAASIERSRTPNVKVTFVLGLNEGIFPAKIQPGGILNARDREQLNYRGIELTASAAQRQLAEYYLIYIAMTRASEQLYLSYMLQDGEGNKALPSMAIIRLKQLFPQIIEDSYDNIPLQMEAGGYDSLGRLADSMQANRDGMSIAGYWQGFWNQYAELPQYKEAFSLIKKGLNFRADTHNLSVQSVDKLFGNRIYSSISRLESFNKCPLQYFANYSLRLRKRKEYELGSIDLGNYFHAVMENICRDITESNTDWADIDGAGAEELVRRHTEQLLPEFLGNIFASTARLRYLQERFVYSLTQALLILREQMMSGEFRQVGWEIRFGGDGILPAFDIPLPDGRILRLNGCIDRLDAAAKDGKVWLRIIDYKSGKKDLRIEDAYYGLSLQLLIYLQVAMLNSGRLRLEGEPHAAGAFYFSFREDIDRVKYQDADAARISVKMSGLAIKDMEAVRLHDKNFVKSSSVIPVTLKSDGDFDSRSGGITEEDLFLLQRHMVHVLEESATKLCEGIIIARPDSNACSYCDFKSFCGFDRDMAACTEEEPRLNKNEILNKLREEYGDGI